MAVGCWRPPSTGWDDGRSPSHHERKSHDRVNALAAHDRRHDASAGCPGRTARRSHGSVATPSADGVGLCSRLRCRMDALCRRHTLCTNSASRSGARQRLARCYGRGSRRLAGRPLASAGGIALRGAGSAATSRLARHKTRTRSRHTVRRSLRHALWTLDADHGRKPPSATDGPALCEPTLRATPWTKPVRRTALAGASRCLRCTGGGRGCARNGAIVKIPGSRQELTRRLAGLRTASS
jgi:hypothetical protein